VRGPARRAVDGGTTEGARARSVREGIRPGVPDVRRGHQCPADRIRSADRPVLALRLRRDRALGSSVRGAPQPRGCDPEPEGRSPRGFCADRDREPRAVGPHGPRVELASAGAARDDGGRKGLGHREAAGLRLDSARPGVRHVVRAGTARAEFPERSSKEQAEYLGVDVAGPYKPEHYRY
jgi:hypothetical protein